MSGADHPDHYDEYYTEKIWAMIPEVYRTEDGLGPQQDVLRQIVEVIAGQAAETRRSIDRLWEDQHIETCDDWAVPYIADLVGTRLLPENDARARRVDVARTVRFRRRRGTPSLLEELARDLSGWGVVLVEAFRRMARTPHRLDTFPAPLGRVTRTPAGGTANLQSPRSLELVGTAFDEFFRTPDPRLLNGRNGRFNLGKFNFHVYRSIPFEAPGEIAADIESINGVTPGQLTDAGPQTFTVDPSGRDVPLFSRGELVTPSTGQHCVSTNEWELAREIPCRLLSDAAFIVSPSDAARAVEQARIEVTAPLSYADDLAAAFRTLTGIRFRSEARLRQRLEDLGAAVSDPTQSWYRTLLRSSITTDSGRSHLYNRSIQIERDLESLDLNLEDLGADIHFDEVMGADLSSRSCHPTPSDPGVKLLVDPKRGRFAFRDEVTDQSPIVLRYFYGFSGQVGAGTYPRTLSEIDSELNTFGGGAFSVSATQTRRIADSLTYQLDLSDAAVTNLVVRSSSEQRPYVQLIGTGAALRAVPDTTTTPELPATLALDGLWLGGEEPVDTQEFFDLVIGADASSTGDFDWEEIRIDHCTLDPGGKRADEKYLPTLRVLVQSSVKLLRISQSIVGPIIVDTAQGGFVETLELVDSIVDARVVPDGPKTAISNIQGDVRFEGITVFGDIYAERLLGTDSVVMGQLIAADNQGSCLRFSAALPPDPAQPEQHFPDRFQTILTDIFNYHFISLRFGDPGYAQLSAAAPADLRSGGEDGSEMGAFSAERRQSRFASVAAKVDEYKPIGIQTQYVFEAESPTLTAE